MLPQIGRKVGAERDCAGEAEIEIGERVAGGVARRRAAALRGSRFAETTGIRVRAIKRIDVQNLGPYGEKLIADFYGVLAPNERVVEFGVERCRVLELRVGRLPTHGRVAESVDDLGGEAARQAGG